KVLAVRRGKFPNLSQEGTAGSFFLNPLVSQEKAAELVQTYPECPHFEAEGEVKLSLAWLLDHVLGVKGMQEGKARLFEKQPLVVVAEFGASSRDVVTLAEKISRLAKEKLHIDLEPEVRIIL